MPRYEDRFAKAAQLWDRGDYQAAMKIYNELLQDESVAKMARGILCEYLGRLHAGLGDFSTAEKFLRRAVSFDPEAVDHQVHLANCLCLVDREEEAWQLVRKLYQRFPEHPVVMHYMGKMLDDRGQRQKGLALMKRAIHLDPLNERLLADLAFSYMTHGNAGAAMVCAEQALALNSEDRVVQFVHELAGAFERRVALSKRRASRLKTRKPSRKKTPRNLKREVK